jgi:hypothetical protein
MILTHYQQSAAYTHVHRIALPSRLQTIDNHERVAQDLSTLSRDISQPIVYFVIN